MNTTHTGYKAKAVIGFCLFFAINCSTAQNTGSYKYIVNIVDSYFTDYCNILEINNHYYVLSAVYDKSDYTIDRNTRSMITVFDENLNSIEQIQLSGVGSKFSPYKFFYENNYFYIFGYIIDSNDVSKPCLAKFDENFKLVQNISLYAMNDSLSYIYFDNILMTEKKEFVYMTCKWYPDRDGFCRFFHINNNGEILQDVFIPYRSDGFGTLVATDSHYIMNFIGSHDILKICKDSFDKYEWVNIKREMMGDLFFGDAITVGNQLVRTYDHNYTCEKDETDSDISILILNEDFSRKHYLIVGNECISDDWGEMDYLNPDSIYFAYETATSAGYGNTVSIANFSLDGVLHFDYTLDLPKDTLSTRDIWDCKALSNGGVLVRGTVYDFSTGSLKTNGFLLLYHPVREDLSVQEPGIMERKVYPNPAQSQFTVTHTENADIQLFNILGQKVLQTRSTGENTVIHTDFLPQGLYVLKVVGDNFSTVHKVQVVR